MRKMIENFGGNVLSRNQMKNLIGAASATANCGGGITVTCSGGSLCAASDPIPSIGEKGGCACVGVPGGDIVKDCPIP